MGLIILVEWYPSLAFKPFFDDEASGVRAGLEVEVGLDLVQGIQQIVVETDHHGGAFARRFWASFFLWYHGC